VQACLLLACHTYKQDGAQDKMLTQVRGTAIFGKRARACTTSVRGPILPLVGYGHCQPRLGPGEPVGSSKICLGANRCQVCGSIYIFRLSSQRG
jgi:hypothetical protein